VRLNEIYKSYRNDIEFLMIYIHEAHPTDGWQTPQNLYDDVVYLEPQNEDERAEIANACQIGLDIQWPLLLDRIDNSTEKNYVSEPIRLFVIDRDGKVTFNGAQGPFGFDMDKWEDALKEIISPAHQAAE
jgi:Iodothyronine deiodinase